MIKWEKQNFLEDISEQEKEQLEQLFQQKNIQEKLQEIENYRKNFKKWIIFSYIIPALTAIYIYFAFWVNEFLFWVPIVIFLGFHTYITRKFPKKVNKILKQEVLSHICPLLYSKLEYHPDDKFSFPETAMLSEKNLLDPYETVDLVEDSLFFSVSENGKHFLVNGFELKTSKVHKNSKALFSSNQRKIINHCYLLKVEFPQARIPGEHDILIKPIQYTKQDIWTLVTVFFIFLGIAILSGDLLNFFVLLVIYSFITLAHIKSFQEDKKRRIYLEHKDFSENFSVYSNDEISSRMILDMDLMEKILLLKQKTKKNYHFLFQKNILYIRQDLIDSYLDISPDQDITKNIEYFFGFYSDMKKIIQLILQINPIYLSKTYQNQEREKNFIPQNTPAS